MDDNKNQWRNLVCDTMSVINTISNNSGITPLKAIKELIDNSIDNEARQIAVVERSTVEDWLCVVDDGSGMTPSMLNNAFVLARQRPKVQGEPPRIGKFGFGANTSVHYLSTNHNQVTKIIVFSSTGNGTVACIEYKNHMGKDAKLKDRAFNTSQELQDKYKSININKQCLKMMPKLDKNGTAIFIEVNRVHLDELRCIFNNEVPTVIPKRHERLELTYPGYFDKGGKLLWRDGITGDENVIVPYDPHRDTLSKEEQVIARKIYPVDVYRDNSSGLHTFVCKVTDGKKYFKKCNEHRALKEQDFPEDPDTTKLSHLGSINIKVAKLKANPSEEQTLNEDELKLFSYDGKFENWSKDATKEAGASIRPLLERCSHVIGSLDLGGQIRSDNITAAFANLYPANVSFEGNFDDIMGVQANKGSIEPKKDVWNQLTKIISLCRKDLKNLTEPKPPPPPPPSPQPSPVKTQRRLSTQSPPSIVNYEERPRAAEVTPAREESTEIHTTPETTVHETQEHELDFVTKAAQRLGCMSDLERIKVLRQNKDKILEHWDW